MLDQRRAITMVANLLEAATSILYNMGPPEPCVGRETVPVVSGSLSLSKKGRKLLLERAATRKPRSDKGKKRGPRKAKR